MEAEFITEPLDETPNPNVLKEPTHRPASYLHWEASADYSRKVIRIDNTEGTSPILPGTVLRDAAGDAVILFGLPLRVGFVEDRTVSHRDCIVHGQKLIFPAIADVAADPDAVPPVLAVDGETATELERLDLIASLAAAGIQIQ